jgi:hypothetical protein
MRETYDLGAKYHKLPSSVSDDVQHPIFIDSSEVKHYVTVLWKLGAGMYPMRCNGDLIEGGRRTSHKITPHQRTIKE